MSEAMVIGRNSLNDNPECIAADKCTGLKATLFRMSEQMIKEHEDLYNEYMSQTKAYQKAFELIFLFMIKNSILLGKKKKHSEQRLLS